MKKDIDFRPVTDVGVAVLPTQDPTIWDVYVLNKKDSPISNVLVSSKGYGEQDGQPIETSSMRYYLEKIEANTAIKIELIQAEVLGLANEYWLSFSHDNYMYDKKFVFVKGSISKDNLTIVPILEEEGVLII